MRTLAIGDIHGSLQALDSLLVQIDLQPDDLLITLGDYVDRGPDSRGVLDRLLSLQERCRLQSLMGNHELMMLAAREDAAKFAEWLACGGKQTLQSYGAGLEWEALEQAVPERHWRLLQADCLPYFESDRHLFVHANVDPQLPLAEQPDYLLFWEALEPTRSAPHESGKIMICGHTQQRSGRPLVLQHAVCIDTWAYGEGWLTCLDVDLEVYWQANRRGETRLGNLQFRHR